MARSSKSKVRTLEPDHQQVTIRFDDPDRALPPEHLARALFVIVGSLDLSGFTRNSKAVEGHAGRSTLSPRMLLTVWLYALTRGVGSAREIERLTRSDEAFRWLTRGLEVSHHSLSAFRTGHGAVLEQLMVDVLAVLLQRDLCTLERVAQDGTRVRASASAPSFRKLASLLDCREQAKLHLKAVLAEADGSPGESTRAAKAREYLARVEEAIVTVQELQAKKPPGAKPARASTTDPEARNMKMPDGGFRPGYNFQLAVAGEETGGPRTIVGFQVTNVGSDMGSLEPMLKQVVQNTGLFPQLLMADANHAKHSDIEYAHQVGVAVLMAVPEREEQSQKVVSEGVLAWKRRMKDPEGKRLYRARAGLVELGNAHFKGRFGLTQVLVRGLEKVTCVGLLACLAFNLTQHAESLLKLI
jgi:transposase